MALIADDVASQLKEEFARLVNPVRLAVFSQALADPESEQVKRLVEELGALDPRLTAESYNFVLDTEKVEALRIARIPAIAILGAEKDYGIRMYGLPSGYEFGTLVDAILTSPAARPLSDETAGPGRAQPSRPHPVFSTPT
jgi:alkyl hydroperoxide reductase subunit AhpF